MENKDLLPCPFCGGEAEIINPWFDKNKILLNHDEGCIVNVAVFFKTKEEAIAAWNTRHKEER